MKKTLVGLFITITCLFSLLPTKSVPIDAKYVNNKDIVSLQHVGETNTDVLFDSLVNKQTSLVQNDYYSNYYFMNLRNNIGNNVYGSCTYVAMGMLLSFYDSYWDDSFIPEAYDVTTEFQPIRQTDFDIIPLDTESPGVLFESNELISNLSMNQYLNIVNQNSDTYFQFKLIQLAKQYFGNEKFDTEAQPLGMNYSELQSFLSYYIYTFNQKSNSDVTLNSATGTSETVRNFTVAKLLNGTPVLLRAKNSDADTGHAMIAYDYDSNTQEIYVHTGWKDESKRITLTHVSLTDLGYDVLCDATAIETNYAHKFSKNYITTSGASMATSNFFLTQNIRLVSGNYRDTLPTFAWDGLFKEKWISDKNPYYKLSILKSTDHQIFQISNINKREYTLTQEQWDYLLFTDTNPSYQIYVEISSDSSTYWDDYWTKKTFSKPKTYDDLPSIAPVEYGFSDAYSVDPDIASQFTQHTTTNGFKFQTKRYRTGYIHNEYIVMSSIRTGYNKAFIEYRFDTAVTRIDVQLSHWRAYSSEKLNSSTGMAELQYYSNNKWEQKIDLLSSSTNLPTDRSSPTTYKIMFEVPTYRIRFYSESFGVNINDNNKGRICIGNIGFYPSDYSLSLSGSELDYNPQDWNNKVADSFLWMKDYVKDYTNCYSYAVNSQINPTYNNLSFMQPGETYGYELTEADFLTPSRMASAIEKDAKKLGFGFIPVEKNERCSLGMYKVALVIDNQYKYGDKYKYDYHWYRQNSDGTWSHKPGKNPVTNLDASKNIIMDPLECDRNVEDGLNYNYFVGYYAIIPLNNYYN